MTVYLDTARNRFGRMVMSHMIADTIGELHDIAAAIGMRREWFQPKSFPHFDVSLTRRKSAIIFGAVVLERREFVLKMREIRARGDKQ